MLASFTMKPPVHKLSLLRTLVLLWASLWMFAFPLIHIHPGIDHRHGVALHTHDVAVHTVLSSDLDVEFEDHNHGDWQEGDSSEAALVDHHSHSLNDHPEVGFTLLAHSSDRKVSKALSTQAIVVNATLASQSDLHTWTDSNPVPIRSSTIFAHQLRSRAPPILLV